MRLGRCPQTRFSRLGGLPSLRKKLRCVEYKHLGSYLPLHLQLRAPITTSPQAHKLYGVTVRARTTPSVGSQRSVSSTRRPLSLITCARTSTGLAVIQCPSKASSCSSSSSHTLAVLARSPHQYTLVCVVPDTHTRQAAMPRLPSPGSLKRRLALSRALAALPAPRAASKTVARAPRKSARAPRKSARARESAHLRTTGGGGGGRGRRLCPCIPCCPRVGLHAAPTRSRAFSSSLLLL